MTLARSEKLTALAIALTQKNCNCAQQILSTAQFCAHFRNFQFFLFFYYFFKSHPSLKSFGFNSNNHNDRGYLLAHCPLSKGNQALHLKFERPNGKFLESKNFLTSVKNLCVQLTWKLTWIKTNQNKWKSMTFFIVLHLKPILLLY